MALAEAGSVYLTRPNLWDYHYDAPEIARRAGARDRPSDPYKKAK